MIRVVLDTNVYLSAILFGGKCARFRELAREGKIEIFVSEPILAELAGVLRRKFQWESGQITLVLEEIRSFTSLVVPYRKVDIVKNDEADNRILECALEAQAHYLVSGDKRHLLPLKKFEGIRIVSPAEFLEFLEKGEFTVNL